MRAVIAVVLTLAVACCAACSGAGHSDRVYGARTARLSESLAVLGWNTSMSNLRWQDDYVLVDVDAAPTDPGNEALLYATIAVVGTHAAVWTTR